MSPVKRSHLVVSPTDMYSELCIYHTLKVTLKVVYLQEQTLEL